jgi:hypothetical protein
VDAAAGQNPHLCALVILKHLKNYPSTRPEQACSRHLTLEKHMNDTYLHAGVRMPFGWCGGALAGVRADDLAPIGAYGTRYWRTEKEDRP